MAACKPKRLFLLTFPEHPKKPDITFDDRSTAVNRMNLQKVPAEVVEAFEGQNGGKVVARFCPEDTSKKPSPQREPSSARNTPPDELLNLYIEVKADGNPKMGKSRDRFNLYHKSRTVADYLEKGGRRADLKWDQERNYISLVPR